MSGVQRTLHVTPQPWRGSKLVCATSVGRMPRLVLTEEQEGAADKAGGADLKYLLARQQVSQENQRLFFHHGVTSVEKLASLAKDRDDLVQVLKDHWDLDQTRTIGERVQVAAIVCAFTNALSRSQKAAEVDAEYEVQDRAKPLISSEWTSMRQMLEKRYGQMEDKETPAKEYVEKKLAEVEAGEYRAEPLTEVVSKDEVDPEDLVPVWNVKGNITLKRGVAKVKEPANAEELRRRLTIMRNSMVIVSLRHTNRTELQGDYERTIEEYKNYLLGDYVYGLVAKDEEGNTIASPPWSLVLSYEHAVRKHAAKLVNSEAKSWVVALKAASRDAIIKERHFTTPLALYAKRPAPPWRTSEPAQPPAKQQKGGKKGQDKGRGKGKQAAAGGHCASHTPQGDLVCYRFNSGEKCKAKKCKYKHVLYVFSGRKRKNSVGGYLRRLSKKHGISVEVVELDIQRNRRDDFSLQHVQKRWLQRITQGEFFAVIVTPPCSTFSRATWANDRGPHPVRSLMHPRGFPWNSRASAEKAELGNLLGDFSFEAMRRQAQHTDHVGMMEQPEDLGRTEHDRIPGQQPASMWQFPQFQQALQEGLRTCVFSQLDFGSESVKPTRLLLKLKGPLPAEMIEDVPHFDDDGYYTGPLPPREGASLIGRQDGAFRTAAAAAWPDALCRWAADTIIAAYQRYSDARRGEGNGCPDEDEVATRKRKKPEEEQPKGGEIPNEDEVATKKGKKLEEEQPAEQPVDPMKPLFPGGDGPPRSCTWKGYQTPFHDGGGLSSPGRWQRGKRRFPMSKEWRSMRRKLEEKVVEYAGGPVELEKEFFRMTKGGDQFKLVRDEVLLGEVRQMLKHSLGLEENALEVPEGQPFLLRLLKGALEKAGDCDYEFLERACVGLPLGVLEPLPRTPGIFEQQVKWALDYDPGAVWSLEKANYMSAVEHEGHLRDHLEAEVKMGLVTKMSLEEFESTYGKNRAIAALAVVVEDEVSGKKRVIHGGTHEIGVNNRIRCRDKVRMPGPREKRCVLEELAVSKEVVMALVGDFEKAHRRFLYQASERGFLACRVSSEDNFVYVNNVGTFGIGSTPYWWARISGALIRFTHYVLGPKFLVEMLLYADDLEVIAPGRDGRVGAVLVFLVMAAAGAPFKWQKQRGGWMTEWVGDQRPGVCSRTGEAELCVPGASLGTAFAGATLCVVFGGLGHKRLAQSTLVYTDAAEVDFQEIGGRAKIGRSQTYRRPQQASVVRVWTDAKATETEAWIGGWRQTSDDTRQCEWFSERVQPWLAPWLGMRSKNPKRVIAALEMLASLVAIKLWSKEDAGRLSIHTEAFTDNRGNEFILKKGMSTKFPIALLVIEVSETLRSLETTADLRWIKREDNQRADDLTNQDYHAFDLGKRIRVTEENCKWVVLGELLPESQRIYDEVQKFKEKKKAEKAEKGSTVLSFPLQLSSSSSASSLEKCAEELKEIMQLQLLVRLLETRLVEVLRFQRGQVYSVAVGTDMGLSPPKMGMARKGSLSVRFECDPAESDELVAATREELQRLRDARAAFTKENVSAAVEQDRREFEELIHTNSWWAGTTLDLYFSRCFVAQPDVGSIMSLWWTARKETLGSFNEELAQQLLVAILPATGHSVVVAMRPKGGKVQVTAMVATRIRPSHEMYSAEHLLLLHTGRVIATCHHDLSQHLMTRGDPAELLTRSAR
eukprot:s433_g7.t1